MFDVCAFGDILTDMTPIDNYPDKMAFECNLGGTAANFAVACARLGLKTSFVGRVGDDILGHELSRRMLLEGIDCSGLSKDQNAFTTQTYVHLKDGERSFSFSRKHAADIALTNADIPQKSINAKVLYFSGMCLTDEPIRSTTLQLLNTAKQRGISIVLDVNYRPALWKSEQDFILWLNQVLPYVDYFKSSEEEALLMTQKSDMIKAAEAVLSSGAKLAVFSRGPLGAFYMHEGKSGILKTYDTKRVDTTGAGDSFMGAMVYRLITGNFLNKNLCKDLEDIIDFSNAAGAVSITCRGGAASMPKLEQIEHCRKNIPKLLKPV